MALPFAFEESVFEEGREATRDRGPLVSPYSARCCEPEWFCEQVNCQDDLEKVNVKKFRGDLAYKQQEFQKALQEYSGCLALVPPSNTAMRRDLKESQARCLAHLGKREEALRIAENLKNGATNTDHVTAVLNLMGAIYHLLGDDEGRIGCLQRLISLHPYHPGTWKLLAEAYLSLLHFPAPSSGTEAGASQHDGLSAGGCLHGSPEEPRRLRQQNQSKEDGLLCSIQINSSFGTCVEGQRVQSPVCTLGNSGLQLAMKRASVGQRKRKDTCLYACASFVRARLLFQLMQLTQTSFALEKNLKTQQEIEDKVSSFGLGADVLSLMTKAMGEDLVREKLKEDALGEVKCLSAATLTAIMAVSAVEFERKWFPKLPGCFSQMDSQT